VKVEKMGNNASQLGDGDSNFAQRDLQFFDHTFKGSIHSCSGAFFRDNFGDQKDSGKPVEIICKGMEAEIVEDEGLKSNTKVIIVYQFVRSS
jgi:hypothetical protein